MLTTETLAYVCSHFPFLTNDPTAAQLQSSAIFKELPAGATIMREGDQCEWLPLVVSGSLRVFKTAETGREITLYYVERGTTCILTTTSMLNSGRFPAQAVATEPTAALLIPARLFSTLVAQSNSWRSFVFSSYAERLDVVIALVEEICFRRIDSRTAAYILEKKSDIHTIFTVTHQEIASALGSSREVISRILKDFEKQGILTLQRGNLIVHKPDELEKIAQK